MGRTRRTPPHMRTRSPWAWATGSQAGESPDGDLCPVIGKVSYPTRGTAERAARRLTRAVTLEHTIKPCPGMGHWHAVRKATHS